MLFFTSTESYLQPASQYMARKKLDLAEIIAHCPMSLTHCTRHFWPSVTLRASARHPNTPEELRIDPGWKALTKSSRPYRASVPLRFSPPACQNAFNNQPFSNCFSPVSTKFFIYLIIKADMLYWRLLKQHNLFSIAIPKKKKKPKTLGHYEVLCFANWSLIQPDGP